MVDFLNNGKVLLGVYYELNPLKPKYVEYDRDMLLLQTALVGDIPAIRKNRLFNIIYIGVLILGVLSAIVFAKN